MTIDLTSIANAVIALIAAIITAFVIVGNGCRRSRRTALHRKRQGRREESIRC